MEFYPVGGSWTGTLTDSGAGACPGSGGGTVQQLVSSGGYSSLVLYNGFGWESDPLMPMAGVWFDGSVTVSCGTQFDWALSPFGEASGTSQRSLPCAAFSQHGSLTKGLTIQFSGTCTYGNPPYITWHTQMSYKEPACARVGTSTAQAYTKLDPALKAGLRRLYDLLDNNGGCYQFSSGYRDQKQVWNQWHQIADQACKPPNLSLGAVKRSVNRRWARTGHDRVRGRRFGRQGQPARR